MPFICCKKLHSLFTQKFSVSLSVFFYTLLLCLLFRFLFVCVCVCVNTLDCFSILTFVAIRKIYSPKYIYCIKPFVSSAFSSAPHSLCFWCFFWGFLVFHHRNDCISVFFLWFLAIHKNALILFFFSVVVVVGLATAAQRFFSVIIYIWNIIVYIISHVCCWLCFCFCCCWCCYIADEFHGFFLCFYCCCSAYIFLVFFIILYYF